MTSLLPHLWPGSIISRRWLWNDRSWNLLPVGHLIFTVWLRQSLSEVFFAENSCGKNGSSTFLLGVDQRLSREGVFDGIYYCPLGSRAPCTCIPLCMRLVILMFWLRASILNIVNCTINIDCNSNLKKSDEGSKLYTKLNRKQLYCIVKLIK